MNLQIKQGVVHKIRPAGWYSDKGKYSTFQSLEYFISAVEETVYQNPKTHESASSWKKRFLKSYEEYSGVKLSIPRWDDIADNYQKK